jgi:murein DD-endopeptidase MepM/ murein hydrolase activator NlpD
MPNRGASRASGFINPADGLTYSGAIVAQVQSQTLAQTNTAAANPGAPLTTRSTTEGSGGGLADNVGSTNNAGLAANAFLSPLGSSAPNTAASSMQAEEDETPELPGGCDTSHSDLYCVYTVQQGDTLSKIAGLFNLKANPDGDYAPHELLVQSNKPDIVDEEDILQPGQKIRVPLNNGVIHTILNADTLSEIAGNFGVTVEEIMTVNGLNDADSLGIGDELLIANPKRFAPVVIAPAPSNSGSGSGSDSGNRNPGTAGGPRSASGLIWPVSGPISSYFGPNHPLGIDIDLFNGRGSAIAASAGGVVTFAGGNSCCSYGLYVVIDHGNGIQTLYAHLSKIGVSVGQVVAQGQYIGNSGSTGYSTGEHLHYEVHVGGAVVNPLSYLP